MTAAIHRRVFVVGCPRSGTTLMQSVLGAHPRVRAFPESHFFARIAEAPRSEAERGLVEFARSAGIEAADVGPSEDITHAFIATLDRAALASGADVWSEKTPRHLHHIDPILEGVSAVAFVHVLRNGRDTVRSLHRVTKDAPDHWGGKPRSLRRCARRWVADVEASLAVADDPRHHLVRYERLTRQPEAVAAELCAFLGIENAAEMLESYPEVAKAITAPGESWKSAAGAAIEPRGSNDEPLDDEIEGMLRAVHQRLDRVLPA